MNDLKKLTTTGILITLVGITILIAKNIGIEVSKTLIPILLLGAGIFSIGFSKANKQQSKIRQYHLLQGIGFIAFAIAAFLCKSLENFLYVVCTFTLFHGLIEFLLGFITLNSKIVKWQIIIYRFIGGFANLIIAFILLITTSTDKLQVIFFAGVSILLSGISIAIFSQKLKP